MKKETLKLLPDEQLQGRVAASQARGPSVTEEAIYERITTVRYQIIPETTVTVCSIHLDNGFSVRGEAACVSAAAFDEALGQRVAFEDAFRKLWPLFGFLLCERVTELTQVAEVFNPNEIGKIANEAVRAVQETLEEKRNKPWNGLTEAERAKYMDGIAFHLDNPNATPGQAHENWLAAMAEDGWVWGEKRDDEAKLHPCMKEFHELPAAQHAKDYLFRAVVHALAPFIYAPPIPVDDDKTEAAD